jgi:hypothetical protein
MSCGSCAKPFGWFTKELGCVRCNRLFCKKCLIYKVQDIENPKRTFLVCLRCFTLNSEQNDLNKSEKSKLIDEVLEVKPNEFTEPVLEPFSSTSSNNNNDDIRKRLDQLKDQKLEEESDKNIDDLQQRLANLKGIDYKPQSGSKVLFSPDIRSEQEKIEDLLKQFVEEKDISDQHDTAPSQEEGSVDDIERRLAALRGIDLSKVKNSQIEDRSDETEQEEINRTMLQYLEEAKLPDIDPYEAEFIASIPPPPSGDKKDLEELPFCEICNEDAVIRCLECENIFCHKCFLEFHDEEDYKTHKTKPYTAPKNADD